MRLMRQSTGIRLIPLFLFASLGVSQTLPESPSDGSISPVATSEQVRLSEILISTPEPYDPAQLGEARAQADKVHEAIQRGTSFDELAKTYSQGPTAALGGDLGYFRHGKLAPSLEELVFGMKVGDVSDVIRTKQGFVVLKVTDRAKHTQSPPVGGGRGDIDVLSDTLGVDFGPYLQDVLKKVRNNWYNAVPEAAFPPLRKQGRVTIEFAILKNGSVTGMKLAGTSGDASLDRGAWAGIAASNPFPALPKEYSGERLSLRFRFCYNPSKGSRCEDLPQETVSTGPKVSIQPGQNLRIRTGKSQKFSVVFLNPLGNGVVPVRWTVAGRGCQGDACGTVSREGLYKAPKKAPEPAFVTVTAALEGADPPSTDSVTIEIVDKHRAD
jgi:TonB family protein